MKKLKSKYKVILVGDTTVGKTSIINNFDNKKFQETLTQTSSVKSNIIKTLELDNNIEIKLDIWDTASQELFRALIKSYYSNADGVIIVYDIKQKSSFDSIKNYWLKEVKENVRENTLKNCFNYI